MTDLKTLIEQRHSANNFIEGVKIPKEDFEAIFDLLKLAPSCFNIQHANYLVITDEEKKEALREAAFNQYKIHTASAAVLVLGDKEAYKKVDSIYSGMLSLKMLSKIDYDKMMTDVFNLYEGRGQEFQRDEAIRNASLSAMMFMMIAKDKGWDTCPMIGFDNERVSKLFNIPENLEPVLLITMGKEDTSKRRMRGYRRPVGEFVTFETFNK
ncbi:nitroreductase family protein [Clostridium folliculivorans]|uniref:Nitroreductase n=1 Tax=Clostridium folliculivorans TaxID=2886038 RepID=A0A9W5Y4Y5_9CLOT|nr:nitroreductase family protein [Clostridium folliculivorans]GKU26573.1 nitroreductase [Clostridium folliculivorans]GKU28995.1 nitroreductase [Clostridium folliculivorans]